MKTLQVFYEEKLVGRLSKSEDLIHSFTYDDDWQKDQEAFPLSLAMPLQKESFGNKITLSFFENLLPEGEARLALEKTQQQSGTYELLQNFGSDCAGAIIISDKKQSPYKRGEKSEMTKIKMAEIFQAIEEKTSIMEVITKQHPGYLSIAGAQDKFVAIFNNDSFYLPQNGHPTTHIIKVPINRSGVKESVYNEYYCMKLAKLAGLDVPHCFIIDDKKHPLFVIERYDRSHKGAVRRIHQQDFCQAQGHVSAEKYESTGGPSIKENFELIKRHVTIKKKSKALFSYLDWISFNLLIGNNDSHSKNISLLLIDGKIELAPFYDLLCTAIYPRLKKNFSFVIGDRDDANRVGKKQLEWLDQELSLKLGTMNQRMIEMRQKLLKEKDELAEEMKKEFPHAKIFSRISDFIQNRSKSLERQGVI